MRVHERPLRLLCIVVLLFFLPVIGIRGGLLGVCALFGGFITETSTIFVAMNCQNSVTKTKETTETFVKVPIAPLINQSGAATTSSVMKDVENAIHKHRIECDKEIIEEHRSLLSLRTPAHKKQMEF